MFTRINCQFPVRIFIKMCVDISVKIQFLELHITKNYQSNFLNHAYTGSQGAGDY